MEPVGGPGEKGRLVTVRCCDDCGNECGVVMLKIKRRQDKN